MRILLTAISILIIWGIKCSAQSNDYGEIKNNGIYTEAYLIRHAFSSGIVSLNYERIIGQKKRISLRAGVYPDFKTTLSFPITCTWITHPLKNHHFEFGLGFVYRVEFYNSEVYHDIPALMIPVMYRYQKNKGFFVRGGINLFYSWPVLPSPSISVGYKF